MFYNNGMPQSKHNVNVAISREVHETLLKIREKAQKDTKENTGIDVSYTLGEVIQNACKIIHIKVTHPVLHRRAWKQ